MTLTIQDAWKERLEYLRRSKKLTKVATVLKHEVSRHDDDEDEHLADQFRLACETVQREAKMLKMEGEAMFMQAVLREYSEYGEEVGIEWKSTTHCIINGTIEFAA